MFYASPQRESSHASSSSAFFGERQASSSFFNPVSVVQRKLNVNSPGDKYEREADAMADKVSLMPESKTQSAPAIQRKCAKCEEEEKGNVMRKEVNDGGFEAPPQFESKLADSKGSGTPMPADTQSFMENAFQADFSGVRIHHNSAATSMSDSIQAKAFTNGNDIYFNSGQYNPHSQEGIHLLAHELTHTQQQGKRGGTLQREPANGAVHAPMPTTLPVEKWGENVEQAYRQAGLNKAANGVQLCRVWGECDKLLTEHEVYEMYRTGRRTAGLGEAQDAQQANMSGAALPMMAGTLRATATAASTGALEAGATTATATTATATAATQGGASLTVLQGGATAATATAPTGSLSLVGAGATTTAEGAAAVTAAEGGAAVAAPATGATLATVAIPVVIGVYVVVSVIDLFSYGAFQQALINQGFTILPSPLGVCIGNCHQPRAPQPNKWPDPIPWQQPFPLQPSNPWMPFPEMRGPVKKPMAPLKPLSPYPQPLPRTLPWEDDDDSKRRCRTQWIEPKFGRYPCHSDYAKLFSGTRLEYQVTAPDGLSADFDAVRGDALIEVKTGYEWMLNKHLTPKMQKRKKEVMARFMEQSIRQFLIGAECGYDVEWYFNSKYMAEMMREELPHVDVKWRPFDCDKDSDHTW